MLFYGQIRLIKSPDWLNDHNIPSIYIPYVLLTYNIITKLVDQLHLIDQAVVYFEFK